MKKSENAGNESPSSKLAAGLNNACQELETTCIKEIRSI
jgi:hypothetical protein